MRAALLLAALAAAAAARVGAVIIAGEQLGGGAAVELPGAPLWRLDRAFQRTCVQLTCSDGKKYEAFEGTDREDVLTRFKQATLSGHRSSFCITPFGTTYLALRPDVYGGLARKLIGSEVKAAAAPRGQYCEAAVSARFSSRLALLALAGAALFLCARALSHSALLRVSSGGAVVSALALVALVLYATRPLWRRNTRLLLAFSGVSLSALYKLWARNFGLQSWHAIATSPYLLGYLGVTFTAGAIATHVLDTPGGPHRERITTAFAALLRAAGLIAICVGVQDWRVGGATAAALCGSELLQRTLAALQPLLRWARARRAARHGVHAVAVADAEAEEQQPLQAGRTPRGNAAATLLYDNVTPSTDPDCAMVRKGFALNPLSDRMIKIGGPAYCKLVATEGYALNRSTGEMEHRGAASEPPGARRGAEAATPGSAVAPRRLERAMAEDSPDAVPAAGSGSAGRSTPVRFASRAPSPPGRKARGAAAGASPKPAARRKSGRT